MGLGLLLALEQDADLGGPDAIGGELGDEFAVLFAELARLALDGAWVAGSVAGFDRCDERVGQRRWVARAREAFEFGRVDVALDRAPSMPVLRWIWWALSPAIHRLRISLVWSTEISRYAIRASRLVAEGSRSGRAVPGPVGGA
jgi:hypothetical protein